MHGHNVPEVGNSDSFLLAECAHLPHLPQPRATADFDLVVLYYQLLVGKH